MAKYCALASRELLDYRPHRRRMTIDAGADPVTEMVITEQDTYTTPLLPGFELPLAQLLAVADAVEAAERR